MGVSRLCLTLAWVNSDRHGPARSTPHQPRATILDIGLDRLSSILAQTDSARHRSRPTRLNIILDRLYSTSAWANSTRHQSSQLSLTWSVTDSDRHGLGSTWLHMGLGRLTRTWDGRLDKCSGHIGSTSALVDLA